MQKKIDFFVGYYPEGLDKSTLDSKGGSETAYLSKLSKKLIAIFRKESSLSLAKYLEKSTQASFSDNEKKSLLAFSFLGKSSDFYLPAIPMTTLASYLG